MVSSKKTEEKLSGEKANANGRNLTNKNSLDSGDWPQITRKQFQILCGDPEMTFGDRRAFPALYLHSLDFELHVVLSGCFPIFPLLPTVPILPVLHFLPVVEDHGAILRSASDKWLSYREN